jgi:predicted RNA binding protein YcfA (HicA-like mRNA interferase family)
MPSLKPISWKKFEKFLLYIGCEFKRQNGGHRIYTRAGLSRPIVLPCHGSDTLPLFIIRNNLKLLGIDIEQYSDLLKKA